MRCDHFKAQRLARLVAAQVVAEDVDHLVPMAVTKAGGVRREDDVRRRPEAVTGRQGLFGGAPDVDDDGARLERGDGGAIDQAIGVRREQARRSPARRTRPALVQPIPPAKPRTGESAARVAARTPRTASSGR